MLLNKVNLFVFLGLIAISSVYSNFIAEDCTLEDCVAPDCRCSSTVLDADIPIANTPQLVTLILNDGIAIENVAFVDELLEGRVNPDGCKSAATFYITHEYTDYSTVHKYWASGNEIGLRSISNEANVQYWRGGSVELFLEEFGGQRSLVSAFANIPESDITGMRVPMFELAANNSFEALVELGLTYDNSWPTQSYISPALWPYSLDFASTQDCPLGNCPVDSIPGAWVAPVLNWADIEDYKCISIDACAHIPEDKDELVQWMITNFHNTYLSNKAPFAINLNVAWFRTGDYFFEAFIEFMDYMNALPDVYFVTVAQSVEYARNPRPIDTVVTPAPETTIVPEVTTDAPIVTDVPTDAPIDTDAPTDAPVGTESSVMRSPIFDECQVDRELDCQARLCELIKESTNEIRWMTICNAVCPPLYPWVGNPLGQILESH